MRAHLSLFVFLFLTPLTGWNAAELAKQNIVVFLADDIGWGDSATYGHKLMQTPNLDKLASQGVEFTQCYAASGVCSPSRSAILTCRTPFRNGLCDSQVAIARVVSTLTRLHTSDAKRSARSLVVAPSTIWQNWNPIENLGPVNLADAPVLLTVAQRTNQNRSLNECRFHSPSEVQP